MKHTIVLRELVTNRLIMIKVMFPVKAAEPLYVAVERKRRTQRRDHCRSL
jgi:hypothetical protein